MSFDTSLYRLQSYIFLEKVYGFVFFSLCQPCSKCLCLMAVIFRLFKRFNIFNITFCLTDKTKSFHNLFTKN